MYKCGGCNNDNFNITPSTIAGQLLVTVKCNSCGRVVTWELKTEIK